MVIYLFIHEFAPKSPHFILFIFISIGFIVILCFPILFYHTTLSASSFHLWCILRLVAWLSCLVNILLIPLIFVCCFLHLYYYFCLSHSISHGLSKLSSAGLSHLYYCHCPILCFIVPVDFCLSCSAHYFIIILCLSHSIPHLPRTVPRMLTTLVSLSLNSIYFHCNVRFSLHNSWSWISCLQSAVTLLPYYFVYFIFIVPLRWSMQSLVCPRSRLTMKFIYFVWLNRDWSVRTFYRRSRHRRVSMRKRKL